MGKIWQERAQGIPPLIPGVIKECATLEGEALPKRPRSCRNPSPQVAG